MNETIEIHEEQKDKGFTLVELLIVIVILGILATVTVFAVGGITGTAEQNACETELATVQTAVEAYYVDNERTYPTGFAQLTATDGNGPYLRDAPAASSDVTIVVDADGNGTGEVTGCA